jgi:hypothetical protein
MGKAVLSLPDARVVKKGRFSKAQIVAILKQQTNEQTLAQFAREYGLSEATFYAWKSKYTILTGLVECHGHHIQLRTDNGPSLLAPIQANGVSSRVLPHAGFSLANQLKTRVSSALTARFAANCSTPRL